MKKFKEILEMAPGMTPEEHFKKYTKHQRSGDKMRGTILHQATHAHYNAAMRHAMAYEKLTGNRVEVSDGLQKFMDQHRQEVRLESGELSSNAVGDGNITFDNKIPPESFGIQSFSGIERRKKPTV